MTFKVKGQGVYYQELEYLVLFIFAAGCLLSNRLVHFVKEP